MIENLNTSIFKLLILSSFSEASLFSQTNIKIENNFSISNSIFSRLFHPVLIHQLLPSTSFNSCLFKQIQTTAIQTSNTDFYRKRILFQLDGCIIYRTHTTINIIQCIFKYCVSRQVSGCINMKKSTCLMQYNSFLSNRGKFGGTFHSLMMKNLTLIHNLFDKNIANYFGAAYIEAKQIGCSQNNFTRNYGTKWVGALELYTDKNIISTMYFFIFDQNSAKKCAAYFDLSIRNSYNNIDIALFVNNSAERKGGAITDFSYQMGANYSNCVFIGNNCTEGNCIYVETKKSLIMLFNCFIDCPKEKAFYFNWKEFPGLESQIICNDDVVFAQENDNELVKKNYIRIQNEIPPISKLEWFLPES